MDRTKIFLITFIALAVSACEPSTPDIIECSIAPGTKTDSFADAGCLVRADNKLLVIRHRSSDALGIPGGGAEDDETAQCTAYRETLEETGLDTIVGKRLHIFDNGFELYACYPNQDNYQQLDTNDYTEVSEIVWLDPQSLQADEWRFPEQLSTIQTLFVSLDED